MPEGIEPAQPAQVQPSPEPANVLARIDNDLKNLASQAAQDPQVPDELKQALMGLVQQYQQIAAGLVGSAQEVPEPPVAENQGAADVRPVGPQG